MTTAVSDAAAGAVDAGGVAAAVAAGETTGWRPATRAKAEAGNPAATGTIRTAPKSDAT